MHKKSTFCTLLLLSTPLHAAVFSLSGSFDNTLTVSTLTGFGNGGTISGTLDTDTNTLTISVNGPNTGTSLRGAPTTPISPITLRLGPSPINIEVDSDGTNTTDSPLLLELTVTDSTGSSPQSLDSGLSISSALATQIVNGETFVTIDGDDGDTAGQLIATQVPEPSSALLIGLAGLSFISRRKRN